ncbi:hypothetical protein D3C80_1096460 [compost metagenome]
MALAAVMPGTTSTGMFSVSSAAISSPARPKIIGSPDFSRTTRLPALARRIIISLMSSCLQLSRPPRFPTNMRFASRRASSRTSTDTRSSNRMTSAACKARTAFSVRSSASPGPAPTSVTNPALEPSRLACVPISVSNRSSLPSSSRSVKARSTNFSQKDRRAEPGTSRRLTRSRITWASAPQSLSESGSNVSMRRRMACARIGAAPSVEIDTTTGERLTMEPNWNWQNSGLSMILTGTPAARAAW